jgi:hypothetical protein
MFLYPEHCRKQFFGMVESIIGEPGVFVIPHYKIKNYFFFAIASDGEGWEHVSVHVRHDQEKASRCPTWEEMCFVKDIFWSDEDTVVQFHPPKAEYVNCHPFCLHLWRKKNSNFETPPSVLVGVKN